MTVSSPSEWKVGSFIIWMQTFNKIMVWVYNKYVPICSLKVTPLSTSTRLTMILALQHLTSESLLWGQFIGGLKMTAHCESSNKIIRQILNIASASYILAWKWYATSFLAIFAIPYSSATWWSLKYKTFRFTFGNEHLNEDLFVVPLPLDATFNRKMGTLFWLPWVLSGIQLSGTCLTLLCMSTAPSAKILWGRTMEEPSLI